MTKPFETRLIMMVAQRPFENNMNQFCKLVPIAFVDGARPSDGDFPNDGEIWWMLTATTARFAEPGRVLTGTLENAVRYDADDPDSSRYQVKRDAVTDLQAADALEIVDVPTDALQSIQDVVSSDFQLQLEWRPAPVVLLRWRSQVYGPFAAQNKTGLSSWTFLPSDQAEMTIYCLDSNAVEAAAGDSRLQVEQNVSLTHHRRADANKACTVRREILLSAGWNKALAGESSKLRVEPLERKLVRFAKECLTRKKRQDLRLLLEELEINGQEVAEAEDLLDAITRLKTTITGIDESLDAVAHSLLEAGMLGEDRIEKAEKRFGEKYVERQLAALQAQIEEQLSAKRQELLAAEKNLESVQSRLRKEEGKRRNELEKQLSRQKALAASEIQAERDKVEQQRAELERQEELLKQNLEQVTKELKESGDDVVNRFLTIAPLLGAASQRWATPIEGSGDLRPQEQAPRAVEIPEYAKGSERVVAEELTEDDFYERFARLVTDSGFTYRDLDLRRFHVSVKCGDLTILGGSSGTGKSSLPMLYARALLGSAADEERPGCLMVSVNPSWMDSRDLLGHLNTLDGQFYPAESGLYQRLIFAQREYERHRASSGVHLVCLDEMNLAQAEHYFGDFMSVLERHDSERFIRCFTPEVAADTCQFRDWGTVAIPRSLRFVGTVNFDETTRALSKRLLDRVNLIRLKSTSLPPAESAPTPRLASCDGPMVTVADFAKWQSTGALPSQAGSLLDSLRPQLEVIGCGLSPRAYEGMCRFVASAAPLIPSASAFDIQLAQRVAPQMGGLLTRRQVDAADEVVRLLQQSDLCAFDETMPLLEEARASAVATAWEVEE